MMTNKDLKYFMLCCVLFVSFFLKAQQDPQFTNYMYNMSIINPAYATDTPDIINFGGFYRSQWVGAVGAPQTATLFGHAPINEKMQVGFSIVNDKIGDVVNENDIYLNYAYILPISVNSNISFGVDVGFSIYDTNFNGFEYSDTQPDPAFAYNINKTFPVLGFGAYYYSDNYYFGFSAPNVLSTNHLESKDGVEVLGIEAVHYFFTGGYVFDLNPNLKFKPAFMVKGVSGAPLSVDLTANFLINNFVEIGAAYRIDDSVSGLINFFVTPTLRIGYSYDYTLSNLGNFNSGSHEIFLLFNLDRSSLSSKGYDKSPRFF